MSVGAVNKQTGERIPTAGMPAIDNALDLTSANPVQNAIITAALANKQDKTDNNLQTTDKTVVGAVNELKSGLTNVNSILSSKQNISLFTSEWTADLTVPQGMCTLIMSAKTNTDALIWSYNSYNNHLVNLTGGSDTITVTKNADNTITITNPGGVVCALVFGQ